MVLDQLGLDDSTALAFVLQLRLSELLALAATSLAFRELCRHAVRSVKLQSLGVKDPGAALLQLANSPLTDGGAAIQEIDASFSGTVSNETLRALPKLPALQVLNLNGCQEVDDDGLIAVAQRCPSLTSLSLYWNVRGTDAGFGRILRAQKGESLKNLCFSGCKHLSDQTVQKIVSRGQMLEVLDLTRCPKVSDAGIQLVCECCDRLQILRLYAMAQLSAQAFTSLSRLVRLEELDLCGCRIEDDAVVDLFTAASPSPMHTLNLTWCPALTDAAVVAIASHCPKLTWLSIFGNTNITSLAIEALAAGASGPLIKALDIRGLTQAAEYAVEPRSLKKIFPSLVQWELHH